MPLKRLLKPRNRKFMGAISRASTIGLHMVSGIAVGIFVGYWFDRWQGTAPWGIGVFLLIGVLAGFRNVYIDLKQLIYLRRLEEQKKHDSENTKEN